jgi:hypothetical protein
MDSFYVLCNAHIANEVLLIYVSILTERLLGWWNLGVYIMLDIEFSWGDRISFKTNSGLLYEPLKYVQIFLTKSDVKFQSLYVCIWNTSSVSGVFGMLSAQIVILRALRSLICQLNIMYQWKLGKSVQTFPRDLSIGTNYSHQMIWNWWHILICQSLFWLCGINVNIINYYLSSIFLCSFPEAQWILHIHSFK